MPLYMQAKHLVDESLDTIEDYIDMLVHQQAPVREIAKARRSRDNLRALRHEIWRLPNQTIKIDSHA